MKIEKENLIPDRSANSLRTAWKKFSQMTKKKFVKATLNKKNARFSHNFEEVPDVETASVREEVKEKPGSKRMRKYINSASTKPHEEELSTPSTPMVDLEVMTKEPSFVNNEDMEFVLEIEDMQSVISNVSAKFPTYDLANKRKRKRHSLLMDLYSNYAEKEGHKRIKITETEVEGRKFETFKSQNNYRQNRHDCK